MIEVTSYTELIGGIQEWIGKRGIRQVDFDKLAGFPDGLSGKVFGPSQVKRLGIEKAFDALLACGLRLWLDEDAEQWAKMQKQIAENCLPRQANQARMSNQASPVSAALLSRCFKHLSRKGTKKRWYRVSKKRRSEHARMMAMAAIKKQRKALKARRAGAAHRAANLAEKQA